MNNNEFERVTGYEDADLPERKTEYAAGYDMKPYESGFVMPGETKLIKTGIKARINYDEYIQMHLRSSVGIKNNIILANGTGIIDADYYNNSENEGHIMIPIRNLGDTPFEYNKNERLAQLIIVPYRITAKDRTTKKRTGGFGSTGNK